MRIRMNAMSSSMRLQGLRQGSLARTAEAEARRRLVVTAIALEHAAAATVLSKIAAGACAGMAQGPPIDFMDGQPLRYRLTDDGHFLLYSVGLDCTDDGGKMPESRRPGASFTGFGPGRTVEGTDLVWPLPANPAAVAAQQEEEHQAALPEAGRSRATIGGDGASAGGVAPRRGRTTAGGKARSEIEGAALAGGRWSEALRSGAGQTNLSLDDLLTVKQIITTNDPDTATFEVPIRYEAATNIGLLHLAVDGESQEPGGKQKLGNASGPTTAIVCWSGTRPFTIRRGAMPSRPNCSSTSRKLPKLKCQASASRGSRG